MLLDLRAGIPVFASIYDGNRHEVASLDEIPVAPGSYYVIDRGYLDFARLHRLHAPGGVLRHQAQDQHLLLCHGLASRERDGRPALRSNHSTQLDQGPCVLSRAAAADPLSRSRNPVGAGFPHQSIRTRCPDHRADLSPPLGHQTFLSLAQTAPATARIFQHLAERGAGSALGRPARLFHGRDRRAAQKPAAVAPGDSASGQY